MTVIWKTVRPAVFPAMVIVYTELNQEVLCEQYFKTQCEMINLRDWKQKTSFKCFNLHAVDIENIKSFSVFLSFTCIVLNCVG